MNKDNIWKVSKTDNNDKYTWPNYHWKYQLHFDMIGASYAGKNEHPQKEFKNFINEMEKEHIKIEILNSESFSIGDCWIFTVKSNTPWLGRKLPSYVFHQGFESDKEGKYS